MTFALIRDSDRAIVEVQDTQGPAFPNSTWVQGNYVRALHLGRIMAQDGTVDTSPDAVVAAEDARLGTLIGDPQVAVMIANLRTANFAQITTYMNSNVTDLASARTMLIRLACVVAYIARRGL